MVVKTSFCSWAFVGLVLSVGCSGSETADSKTEPDELPEGSAQVGGDGGAPVDATWCQARDVFATHCTSCHTQGGVGPMPLETHDDLTRESAKVPGVKTYTRVGVRIHDEKSPMPPRGRLDEASLRVLDGWIAAGAPDATSCGDAGVKEEDKDEPWPTNCDATYRLLAHAEGSPDAPFKVPARQEIHPKISFDAPWGDEEVQAIAFRPITDNKAVLHHWILNSAGSTFLTGWAPGGTTSAPLPSDVGMYMPSGKNSMYLDMHYYNLESASDVLDQSGVEVCVLRKANFRPNVASVFRSFGSLGGSDFILAPAATRNHDEEGKCTVRASQPVRLLTAAAHAHTYAVHMKFTVKKADGRVIVMHDAPFSFDAQGSHLLPEEVILETGDVVSTICTYSNLSNTNIFVGESTTSEMCFNFAVYYPMGALGCSNRALL